MDLMPSRKRARSSEPEESNDDQFLMPPKKRAKYSKPKDDDQANSKDFVGNGGKEDEKASEKKRAVLGEHNSKTVAPIPKSIPFSLGKENMEPASDDKSNGEQQNPNLPGVAQMTEYRRQNIPDYRRQNIPEHRRIIPNINRPRVANFQPPPTWYTIQQRLSSTNQIIQIQVPNFLRRRRRRSPSNFGQFVIYLLTKRKFEWLCAIPSSYINDDFNLTNLEDDFPLLIESVELLIRPQLGDYIRLNEEEIVSSALDLYHVIHARYITTMEGLAYVEAKYREKQYGVCPRLYCFKQAVLPYGISFKLREHVTNVYCPKCNQIYSRGIPNYQNIDGAAFGSNMVNLFFMTYPKLRPVMVVDEELKKRKRNSSRFRIHHLDPNNDDDSESSTSDSNSGYSSSDSSSESSSSESSSGSTSSDSNSGSSSSESSSGSSSSESSSGSTSSDSNSGSSSSDSSSESSSSESSSGSTSSDSNSGSSSSESSSGSSTSEFDSGSRPRESDSESSPKESDNNP